MALSDFAANTDYLPLMSLEDTDLDTDDNDLVINETNIPIHECGDGNKGTWNHIQDLDDFFRRVYQYHQKGGFGCMLMEDFFAVFQFVFIVCFAFFLGFGISYPVLFHYNENDTHKVTLDEVIIPVDQVLEELNRWWLIPLIAGFVVYFVYRLIRVGFNIFKYLYIRSFFINALKIPSHELSNMTWHEVQARLMEVQKEHQMCIHKRELSQLDIYHRILRFHNYMVAMANRKILPFSFNLPFVGEYYFFSAALKYNLEQILFHGLWAPFDYNWHLRSEFKNIRNKAKLTKELESRIFWFGLLNLLFCPMIFIFNILYFVMKSAEIFKQEPGNFGMRRWSNYSRLYLRHFNELDHEFRARLKRGHRPLTDYLNSFISTPLVIIAKNVRFLAYATLGSMVAMTVIDEDVLTVEHVLSIMALLGLAGKVAAALIPDQGQDQPCYVDRETETLLTIDSPEQLLRNVAMAIHYMPENWAGHAHTARVRNDFGGLFQYLGVYLVEELLSPLITPFILLFWVRPRAGSIVDFLRQFTVDVVGVGDVCSFAQMEVRKHGNSKWQIPGSQTTPSSAPKNIQAENGKTEMSLIHFHYTNPEWKPDAEGDAFINNLKSQVHHDIQGRSMMTTEGFQSLVRTPLALPGLIPGQPVGPYTSIVSSLHGPQLNPTSAQSPGSIRLRGAVSQLEGPVIRPTTSLFGGSMHSSVTSSGGLTEATSMQGSFSQRHVDECTRQLMTNEMNISALYMHEMRWRRGNNSYLSLDEYARAVWQSPDGNSAGGGASLGYCSIPSAQAPPVQGHEIMPEIAEEGSADDEREVDTSMAHPPSHHQTGYPPL